MKIIGWINGWVECPECWQQLLWPPLRISRSPGWMSVQVLGFVVFLAREPETGA